MADECIAKAAAELFELARATANGNINFTAVIEVVWCTIVPALVLKTDDNPPSDHGEELSVSPPLDIAVSCDGTWQRRGHQSLYGVQAAISSESRMSWITKLNQSFVKSANRMQVWTEPLSGTRSGRQPTSQMQNQLPCFI